MGKNNLRKPLGQTIWIKVVLTILVFLPPITEISYNSMNTTDVIASVLSNPAIVSIPVLLPVAKLILLICVVMTIIADRFSARALLGYYCIILLFVSIFQNMAVSKDYGFAWLPGNTLVQFFVLSYCLYDLLRNKTQIKKENINRKRLWVAIPMLLAFLMPYSVDMNGVVRPSFTFSVLWNESGLTYCMITPIIIGLMLVYSKGIYKPVMSVLSYVGFIFGLLKYDDMVWNSQRKLVDGCSAFTSADTFILWSDCCKKRKTASKLNPQQKSFT